jgi:hypothetical protein
MKLPQISLRDLFWLVLVCGVGFAALINASPTTEYLLYQLSMILALVAIARTLLLDGTKRIPALAFLGGLVVAHLYLPLLNHAIVPDAVSEAIWRSFARDKTGRSPVELGIFKVELDRYHPMGSHFRVVINQLAVLLIGLAMAWVTKAMLHSADRAAPKDEP